MGIASGLAACNRPAVAPAAESEAAPLLARADLFGEPLRQDARLSPRGDRIAFVAPRDGAPNIWVVSVSAMDQPRPITDEQIRGVREFWWALDSATLLYIRESADGGRQLFAVPAAGGEARALTPEGARADVLGLSPSDPGGVLVSLNQRDPAWPDVLRIDVATGERTLVQRNSNSASNPGFVRFVVDRENHVRLGLRAAADGGAEVFARNLEGGWVSLFAIPFEDANASRPIAFEADGQSFLMLDSTGRDRAALVRVDAVSGVKTVLGESQRADVIDVWLDPTTNAPEAYAADYLRRDWRALDADAQADLDFLDSQLTGDAIVTSRSLDDSRWIVVEDSPTTPGRSYLYDRSDRANRRLTLLFRHRPALEQAALQPMTPLEIESRDGLTLVSYLTLPAGSDANGDARPDHPVPMVVIPHEDAWARDSYGYDAQHQWLANRGYAVLSVNFRGSSGFGKAFANQGNGEWGGRMQEDLIDAVDWAVQSGIAVPDRVAIMGAGYGGYATLAGLAFTPGRFRCGVSLSAPVNLATMLERTPAYDSSTRAALYLRVGDPRTAEGRQLLRERSPLTRVGEINAALLLAMGAQDAGVARGETDQVAQSLRARRLPLIYLNYPDEGAVLTRPQNRLSYYAVAEQFLGECLGGRVEPVGTAFDGASVQAIDGAERVPGLSAFARRSAPAPASASGSSGDDATPPPVVTGGAGGAEMYTAPVDAAPAPPPANDN